MKRVKTTKGLRWSASLLLAFVLMFSAVVPSVSAADLDFTNKSSQAGEAADEAQAPNLGWEPEPLIISAETEALAKKSVPKDQVHQRTKTLYLDSDSYKCECSVHEVPEGKLYTNNNNENWSVLDRWHIDRGPVFYLNGVNFAVPDDPDKDDDLIGIRLPAVRMWCPYSYSTIISTNENNIKVGTHEGGFYDDQANDEFGIVATGGTCVFSEKSTGVINVKVMQADDYAYGVCATDTNAMIFQGGTLNVNVVDKGAGIWCYSMQMTGGVLNSTVGGRTGTDDAGIWLCTGGLAVSGGTITVNSLDDDGVHLQKGQGCSPSDIKVTGGANVDIYGKDVGIWGGQDLEVEGATLKAKSKGGYCVDLDHGYTPHITVDDKTMDIWELNDSGGRVGKGEAYGGGFCKPGGGAWLKRVEVCPK